VKLRIAAPAALLLLVSVSSVHSADFVYFSETPGSCAMETVAYAGQTFSVFVLLDDPDGVTGLSFRLESNRFDAGDVQSVIAAPGVTIEGGNIFDGIALALDRHEFHHTPVLDIVLSGHAAYGAVWTRDIEVMRSGASKTLADQVTVAQDFDCFGSAPHWEIPVAVDVVIGRADEFTFLAGLNSGSYPPDAEVRVADADGWIDESVAFPVEVVCGWCPWSGTVVTVQVAVPAAVADNTHNDITLEMYSFGLLIDSRSVTLRAVSPVPTEARTWGRVKSLYR
jgi:hypothetical protein